MWKRLLCIFISISIILGYKPIEVRADATEDYKTFSQLDSR